MTRTTKVNNKICSLVCHLTSVTCVKNELTVSKSKRTITENMKTNITLYYKTVLS